MPISISPPLPIPDGGGDGNHHVLKRPEIMHHDVTVESLTAETPILLQNSILWVGGESKVRIGTVMDG